MKQDSFKGRDFISHLCKGRSTEKDHPYQIIIASEYVYAPMSREELKGLADFINKFLEKNV